MDRITEKVAYEMYDGIFDDTYIVIAGLRFLPSEVVKKLDPIAYEVGFNDFTDSLLQDDILVENQTDDGFFKCDECDELTDDFRASICKDCDKQILENGIIY